MWTALQTAISTKLLTATGHLYGNRYYVQAVPEDAPYPFVTSADDLPSTPWYTLGGGSKGEDLLWPFAVWCDFNHGGPTMVDTISSAIETAFADGIVTVPGYSTLLVMRVWHTRILQDPDDASLFTRMLRYRVWLEKT